MDCSSVPRCRSRPELLLFLNFYSFPNYTDNKESFSKEGAAE